VHFLLIDHNVAFVTIGAVFLAVTGAEALYVDLGHFGRRPIVTAWLAIVFPCLLLNYFGQGAYVLSHAGGGRNPFFQMQPDFLLIPMVVLATAATVIASQAVISGAYSLTKQAVQLNILPRMEIQHTSETQEGQIFMPRINWLLGVGVVLLVVGFQSSSALASAYGISVTGEMLVTAILLLVVMRRVWHWSLLAAISICGLFFVIDATFFLSNAVKVVDGGWVSLCVAAIILLLMWTWVRGSRLLFDKTRKSETPIAFLAANLSKKPPHTVPGTAVFLTGDSESAPTALLHSLKHYHVLHEHNVILSIVTADQPTVPQSERARIEKLSPFFMRVTLTFGYMEQPNVPSALVICRKQGWTFDIMKTSFFLSRRSLKASAKIGLPLWQAKLFIFLARTASDATQYFRIPTGRVVEIGTQVVI
jgi:KUP system potassium uptake protein